MKNGRNTAGHFSPGNSGRPHGSRNKATLAIDAAEATGSVLRAVIEGELTPHN